MAEFASNGKGNLGVTLGAIGTGLGVLGGGLGNLGLFNGFGNRCMNYGYNGFDGCVGGYRHDGQKVPQYVSKDEADKDSQIAELRVKLAFSDAEKSTDAKLTEVYERIGSRTLDLERQICEMKGAQAVINNSMNSAIAVNANNIAALQNCCNSLTKTIIPITNVCPEPMKLYNSWTAPTTAAAATASN